MNTQGEVRVVQQLSKAACTVVSISRNPDSTMAVSYTGKGGANGVCTLKG